MAILFGLALLTDGAGDAAAPAADVEGATATEGSLGAAVDEGSLLQAANAARDAKAAEVGSSKATVVGGYNVRTGQVAAVTNGPLGCAEDYACTILGGNPADVRFTTAIRPRTGKPVPVCLRCQQTYSPDQFPLGTQFLPGWWVDVEEALGG